MKVLITGGIRGIGLAFAKVFLEFGDEVCITSRSKSKLSDKIEELQSTFDDRIMGYVMDVTDYNSINELGAQIKDKWHKVDLWINNAGINSCGYQDFSLISPDSIKETIDTNITGILWCCQVAIKIMKDQNTGHIINMAGMGSNGRVSSQLVIYGTSKRPIPYITKALQDECKKYGLGIHTISPGMVVTDLLSPHIDETNYKIINILSELPETVAKEMVPKLRNITGSGKHIYYLTKFRSISHFLNARKRKERFYGSDGILKVKN